MTPFEKSIFRPDAVRRHMRSRDESVLPRFGGPRPFRLLWGLVVVMLLGVGALCWLARVPVYAQGYAVPDGARQHFVIFLEPEYRPRLRAGQQVRLRRGQQPGAAVEASVVAVGPEVLSADAARERFGLDVCALPTAPRGLAVALADLDADAARAQGLAGAYRADVEIGARRAGTLLPVLGRLFRE